MDLKKVAGEDEIIVVGYRCSICGVISGTTY